MNVDTKTIGYKLNLSMNSYVCEICVEKEKERVINIYRQNKEQIDDQQADYLKFRSKRDGIISFYKAIILVKRNEDNKEEDEFDDDEYY